MTFPGPTSPFPLPFIKTDFPLFLAPMAGVTDPIFRTICKELGADVMVTEFVSADRFDFGTGDAAADRAMVWRRTPEGPLPEQLTATWHS